MKHTSRDTHSYSKSTFAGLFVLVGMVMLYLYFLNFSVVQVVLRTEYTTEQNELRTEIAQLEAQYIESQHSIAALVSTLDRFDTDVTKVFVSRTDASLAALDTQ